MIRTIYRFYCYKCYKLNVSAIPHDLDVQNGLIERIFCPNCKTWVFCSNTNLSPKRYKIINKSKWHIIDEDSPNNTTIYANKSYESTLKICEQLNQNKLSVSSLHDSYPIFRTINWYRNLS